MLLSLSTSFISQTRQTPYNILKTAAATLSAATTAVIVVVGPMISSSHPILPLDRDVY